MVWLLAVVLLFGGCASFQLPTGIDRLPELVESVPLPVYQGPYPHPELTLELRLHITADGAVDRIFWETRSGDPHWDSLAVREIAKWRYRPAIAEGQPVPIWIRQTVRVMFEEGSSLPLAELVCETRELADSLYILLKEGADFATLARLHSVAASADRGGVRGETDLRQYPSAIRRILRRLNDDEITQPLEWKTYFVILKRLPKPQVAG